MSTARAASRYSERMVCSVAGLESGAGREHRRGCASREDDDGGGEREETAYDEYLYLAPAE